MKDLKYIGKVPESAAKKYKDKKYVGVEIINGRKIKMYDVWQSEVRPDEERRRNNLDKSWVKLAEKWIKGR